MKIFQKLKKKIKKVKNDKAGSKKVLLNMPIESVENDWIGIESYVDRLNNAIESGAQVVGITSNFGTGKSSLLSLYETKYISSKWICKKKLYNINLWDCIDAEGTELHKTFLYRVISKINSRKGSYISKRLSNNYGLLSLQSRSLLQTFIAVCMFILGLISIGTHKYSEKLVDFLSVEESTITNVMRLSLVGTIFLAVILFINADIVFSSVKSEGKANTDENIIVDFFYKEVLRSGWFNHYIFVIEDLDRSNNMETVLNFLKQLRRYYFPYERKHKIQFLNKCKNKVTFVVCIKPEPLLIENIESDSLFPKIFDYIINLNQINIDNYDAILNGFLSEIADTLIDLKLIENKEQSNINSIREMSWLVRGKEIGIRDLKNRLNMSLLLYENLISKFPEKGISFEKCAITVYLMTEYSGDFYKLADDTFESLLEKYVSNELDEDTQKWGTDYDKLGNRFKGEILDLIKSKKIDSTYRTYFYNYPKKSKLYNAEQMTIYNSIVYGEVPANLADYDRMLENVDDEVINDALGKLSMLSINLPVFILDFDKLSKVVVKNYGGKLIELIGTFPFDQNNVKRSSENICKIISKRAYVENKFEWLEKIGNCIFERISDMNTLFFVRQEIGKTIGNDIVAMKKLFLENNVPFISENEIDEIKDALTITKLIKYNELARNIEICKNIHLKIIGNISVEDKEITRFYVELGNTDCEESATYTKEYCYVISTIPDEIVELYDKKIDEKRWKVEDFIKAITVTSRITTNQLKELIKLLWTDGLPHEVCNELHKAGFEKLYVANGIMSNLFADDLEKEIIYKTILADVNWFCTYANKAVNKLRGDILKKKSFNKKYSFLFKEPFEIITKEEVNWISDYETVIDLVQECQLDEEQIEYLAKYFGKKHRNPRETAEILTYVIGLPKAEAKIFFYSLDLDTFSYKRMSGKNRRKIEEKLFEILDMLDDAEEIVKFLKHTKTANQELEKDLYIQLRNNEQLRDEYIEFVNTLSLVNTTTIKNITNLGVYAEYSEVVNKRLFDAKNYVFYVYSKYLHDGYFEVEEEKKSILWTTYVKMFHWNNEKKIINKMRENELFMQNLVENKEYENAENVIDRYSSALQTKDLLLYLFETLTEKQMVAYFSEIKGFLDYDASHCFIEKIQEHKAVVASDEVYKNCHGKMINPGLEGWYTKIYKKS